MISRYSGIRIYEVFRATLKKKNEIECTRARGRDIQRDALRNIRLAAAKFVAKFTRLVLIGSHSNTTYNAGQKYRCENPGRPALVAPARFCLITVDLFVSSFFPLSIGPH